MSKSQGKVVSTLRDSLSTAAHHAQFSSWIRVIYIYKGVRSLQIRIPLQRDVREKSQNDSAIKRSNNEKT